MERHCDNALKVAQHLKDHPKVSWVSYAALPDSRFNAVARRITRGKGSGILSFGIKGGKEAGAKFIDGLQMILRRVNIGDAKSLACHPASTQHRHADPDAPARAGVSKHPERPQAGPSHTH